MNAKKAKKLQRKKGNSRLVYDAKRKAVVVQQTKRVVMENIHDDTRF